MPRPTKLATAMADAIGETPSRVQGWIDGGYGPADDRDPAEHFRRLAPLTGTGRDGDVAVLKMAADGYPCRRLRADLAELARVGDQPVENADQLIEHLMQDETIRLVRDALIEHAHGLPVPGDLATSEPALDEVTVGAAMLPIADAVVGNPVELRDTAELERMSPWVQLGMPEMPFDDDAGLVNLRLLAVSREIVRSSQDWLTRATPTELARGVGAARAMIEGLGVAYPQMSTWGDVERWRFIGRIAPFAVGVLAACLAAFDLADQISGGQAAHWLPSVAGEPPLPLPPAMRAFMDAIRQGRRFVAPEPDRPETQIAEST